MESPVLNSSKKVDTLPLEDFHELLRGYTDIFIKKIYLTGDNSYEKLKKLINNKNIVVLRGNKDSSIVLMDRNYQFKELKEMADDRIVIEDTTLKEFHEFLYRTFSRL